LSRTPPAVRLLRRWNRDAGSHPARSRFADETVNSCARYHDAAPPGGEGLNGASVRFQSGQRGSKKFRKRGTPPRRPKSPRTAPSFRYTPIRSLPLRTRPPIITQVDGVFDGAASVIIALAAANQSFPFKLPPKLELLPEQLVRRLWLSFTSANLHEGLLRVCLRLNHSFGQRFHPKSEPPQQKDFPSREDILIDDFEIEISSVEVRPSACG